MQHLGLLALDSGKSCLSSCALLLGAWHVLYYLCNTQIEAHSVASIKDVC